MNALIASIPTAELQLLAKLEPIVFLPPAALTRPKVTCVPADSAVSADPRAPETTNPVLSVSPSAPAVSNLQRTRSSTSDCSTSPLRSHSAAATVSDSCNSIIRSEGAMPVPLHSRSQTPVLTAHDRRYQPLRNQFPTLELRLARFEVALLIGILRDWLRVMTCRRVDLEVDGPGQLARAYKPQQQL